MALPAPAHVRAGLRAVPPTPPVWQERKRARAGPGPHDRSQRNGRGPDAGRVISPSGHPARFADRGEGGQAERSRSNPALCLKSSATTAQLAVWCRPNVHGQQSALVCTPATCPSPQSAKHPGPCARLPTHGVAHQGRRHQHAHRTAHRRHREGGRACRRRAAGARLERPAPHLVGRPELLVACFPGQKQPCSRGGDASPRCSYRVLTPSPKQPTPFGPERDLDFAAQIVAPSRGVARRHAVDDWGCPSFQRQAHFLATRSVSGWCDEVCLVGAKKRVCLMRRSASGWCASQEARLVGAPHKKRVWLVRPTRSASGWCAPQEARLVGAPHKKRVWLVRPTRSAS
eukprot:gene7306-biopygen8